MENSNTNVYLLAIAWERTDGMTEINIEVYSDKEHAIEDAKGLAEGQKRIECSSITGFIEYKEGLTPSIPSLPQMGMPLYASRMDTTFLGKEYRTWRGVYEKRLF